MADACALVMMGRVNFILAMCEVAGMAARK
jgi:hypothetical protein